MEIKIRNRDFYDCENMVFHCYCTLQPHLREVKTFVSVFYEGAPAFQSDNTDPLLLCYGKGQTEWAASLACFDILLGATHKKKLGPSLETWTYTLADSETRTCKLCIQIRYQGQLQNLSIPEPWVYEAARTFKGSHTSQMVYAHLQQKTSVDDLDPIITHLINHNHTQ